MLAVQDKTEVLSKLDPRIWHGTLDKVGQHTASFTGPAHAWQQTRMHCDVECTANGAIAKHHHAATCVLSSIS